MLQVGRDDDEKSLRRCEETRNVFIFSVFRLDGTKNEIYSRNIFSFHERGEWNDAKKEEDDGVEQLEKWKTVWILNETNEWININKIKYQACQSWRLSTLEILEIHFVEDFVAFLPVVDQLLPPRKWKKEQKGISTFIKFYDSNCECEANKTKKNMPMMWRKYFYVLQ